MTSRRKQSLLPGKLLY